MKKGNDNTAFCMYNNKEDAHIENKILYDDASQG